MQTFNPEALKVTTTRGHPIFRGFVNRLCGQLVKFLRLSARKVNKHRNMQKYVLVPTLLDTPVPSSEH